MSRETAELIWNLAIAIRRLLILLGDRDPSAVHFAKTLLAKADSALKD